MRRYTDDDLWTSPRLPLSEQFHRMSYALYRSEGDVGRVVGTRNPSEGILTEGDLIQDRLELSDEALTYMADRSQAQPPLFLLTKVGLGILSNRYALSAGVGLYLHLHTKPRSAGRILNSGALGSPEERGFRVSHAIKRLGDQPLPGDEVAYTALLTAVQALPFSHTPLLKTHPDECLTCSELLKGMAQLSSFVGVPLSFTSRRGKGEPPLDLSKRLMCCRPLLTEAFLLCLFSEMRTHSATRGGICRLEANEKRERDGIALTLRYPVDPSTETTEPLRRQLWHSHMTAIGELYGLDLWFSPSLQAPRVKGGLPERVVILDQLRDPSLLESSDIKSPARFYSGGERRGCIREEEESLIREALSCEEEPLLFQSDPI